MQYTRYFFVVFLILFGVNAHSNEGRVVDPKTSILSVVSDDAISGWVKVGTIDVDGDGDEDVLVAHEYISENNMGHSEKEAPFLIYFNEKHRFVFFKDVSPVFIQFDNVEYRKIEGIAGRQAFINYKKRLQNDCRIFEAYWVVNNERDDIEVRQARFSTDFLLPADSNDVVAGGGDGSLSCGLSIDEVLNEYREMTADEALDYFSKEENAVIGD